MTRSTGIILKHFQCLLLTTETIRSSSKLYEKRSICQAHSAILIVVPTGLINPFALFPIYARASPCYPIPLVGIATGRSTGMSIFKPPVSSWSMISNVDMGFLRAHLRIPFDRAFKFDGLVKSRISHRALREHRDKLLTLLYLSLRALRLCAKFCFFTNASSLSIANPPGDFLADYNEAHP